MDLYWIDPSLAIASRPRGGDWLDDEMASLRRQGVDILVSCLASPEERELGLSDEERAASRAGIAFARAPIEDRGTPASTADFEGVIRRLTADRRAGRRVAVHCRQGLGRGPLVAAAVLVRSGFSADEAWNLIRERRNQPVPDTDEQREWVHAFARNGEERRSLTARGASAAAHSRRSRAASAGGRGCSRPSPASGRSEATISSASGRPRYRRPSRWPQQATSSHAAPESRTPGRTRLR